MSFIFFLLAQRMKGAHGMAVLMPCWGWIRRSSVWAREVATQASLSISLVAPAGPTVSLWLAWMAAQGSEPCPELVCLFPAKHSLPVAMEVGKHLMFESQSLTTTSKHIKELKHWIIVKIPQLFTLNCTAYLTLNPINKRRFCNCSFWVENEN